MFYNLLTAPRTVPNTYAQVARAQSCASHVQHIERFFFFFFLSTCCVTCHVVRRGSSAFKSDRILNRIYLSFIPLAEPLTDEGGEETGCTRKKSPGDELQKCHILEPEDSSPNRDSNPRSSIGSKLGKQMCSPLHHASPLELVAG